MTDGEIKKRIQQVMIAGEWRDMSEQNNAAVLEFASYAYNLGRDGKGFKDSDALEKWTELSALSQPAQSPVAVPDEVLRAVERMSQPLHESRLKGATAEADAQCMKVIADFIGSLAAPLVSADAAQPMIWYMADDNGNPMHATCDSSEAQQWSDKGYRVFNTKADAAQIRNAARLAALEEAAELCEMSAQCYSENRKQDGGIYDFMANAAKDCGKDILNLKSSPQVAQEPGTQTMQVVETPTGLFAVPEKKEPAQAQVMALADCHDSCGYIGAECDYPVCKLSAASPVVTQPSEQPDQSGGNILKHMSRYWQHQWHDGDQYLVRITRENLEKGIRALLAISQPVSAAVDERCPNCKWSGRRYVSHGANYGENLACDLCASSYIREAILDAADGADIDMAVIAASQKVEKHFSSLTASPQASEQDKLDAIIGMKEALCSIDSLMQQTFEGSKFDEAMRRKIVSHAQSWLKHAAAINAARAEQEKANG